MTMEIEEKIICTLAVLWIFALVISVIFSLWAIAIWTFIIGFTVLCGLVIFGIWVSD